ncbi:hypothetical protein MPH_05026 [Macrophomina phaseolina MS6]|uniref:Uncharacterized protein n=1 Tax=Macrophomina phaseolina (strain MS6) TaxID=1126212 RepID=K2R5T2_MACPH|nr:hypothetical protein MPH_05026 [Macrophomina phaseolina MS6]
MTAATPRRNNDHSSHLPQPAAEPMSRTDSGFEDYPLQPKSSPPPEEFRHGRSSSFSETAEESVGDVFSTSNQTVTPAPGENGSSSAPESQAKPRHDARLKHRDSHSTLANTASVPSTPERPGLKKRRSRPSSKHSVRSSSRRSSSAYHRPSLSTRVRSLPADLPLHRSDLDSVLALHSRSCNLFSSLSSPSSAPQSPGLSSVGRLSTDIAYRPLHVDTSSLVSTPSLDPAHTHPMPSPAISTFSSHVDVDIAEVSTPVVPPATVIHWNSPSTRRREYAEIDRSTKGFRGFLRRVTPRWLSRRPPRQAFYDDEKDDDDACSVRRYRIELPDDDGMSTACKKKEKERPSSAPSRMAKLWKCY